MGVGLRQLLPTPLVFLKKSKVDFFKWVFWENDPLCASSTTHQWGVLQTYNPGLLQCRSSQICNHEFECGVCNLKFRTTALGEPYYGSTAYSIWRDNQSFSNLALQSRSSISNRFGVIFWFSVFAYVRYWVFGTFFFSKPKVTINCEAILRLSTVLVVCNISQIFRVVGFVFLLIYCCCLKIHVLSHSVSLRLFLFCSLSLFIFLLCL